MNNKFTHGSFFTGIGVFDYAAQLQGFDIVFGCDNDPFAKCHFTERHPLSIFYDDIKTVQDVPTVDLLTFGFPCQDASIAAPVKKKNPLNESRTGLFWDAIRLVRQSRPKFVIAENVARLRNAGLEECLRAFATSGYHVGYAIIPACTFGAIHERERIFIIAANADSIGRQAVLCVLNDTLTTKEGLRLGDELYRVLCTEMESEAYDFDVRTDYGYAYWLYEGLRAKALGNSIFFPIAEMLVKNVKIHL
jgi:DNA (cytosine-5)-methyltransferase 1